MRVQFPCLNSVFSQHMPDPSRSMFRLEWHLVDSIIVRFHLLSIWKIFLGIAQIRVMYSRWLWKAYYMACFPRDPSAVVTVHLPSPQEQHNNTKGQKIVAITSDPPDPSVFSTFRRSLSACSICQMIEAVLLICHGQKQKFER